MQKPVVLLMGPTASGKTDVAIQLATSFNCDLISVDSALVYRDMNIGTAKPDAETLARAPHQLVDILDPHESYSAGEFVRDACAAIDASHAAGRIPLLVGGTMMYFRALTQGIAELPQADPELRAKIDAQAEEEGWPAMHRLLSTLDPESAKRLQPTDKQRIQRALEVFYSGGVPLSELHARSTASAASRYRFVKIALVVEPRSLLHERIEQRLDQMLVSGFEDEMRCLYQRDELTADMPSMRSVGYRQFWQYLDGEIDRSTARDRTLFATRQLAKRQLTWLRSETDVFLVDALEDDVIATITSYLVDFLHA